MDAARKVAGFTELPFGINNGIAPNLLTPEQAFNAVNVTFRGDIPQTRDPWVNHVLNNLPATWSGIFQGSIHYDGEAGQSGWLVARGGRFFFITDDSFTAKDVTPQLIIVTVGDFIQPGAGNNITITINGNPPLSAGNTITIQGIQYTVVSTLLNGLVLKQVTASTTTSTNANYTQPVIGATVSVTVLNSASFIVGQPVSIATGGTYHIQSIPDNTHIVVTNLGLAGNAASGTVINSPQTVTPGVASGVALFDSTNTNQLVQVQTYPTTLNFVYMFQAENYVIILGGQEKSLIWDGKQLRQAGPQEVPSGFVGAYGWGRIWITLPNRRTFVAGDIVFGPSGTAQNGFRDAILKFTENTFLNEGGSFGVPYNAGPITAMQFLATQDTSLGIGVLLVGTTNMVFSVNAPVDRTTWKNLTYPIQTVSLIDYGPLGPRSTVPVNGDMWYRSLDGVRSFIVARRLMGSPGNTPMSHEVPILDNDTSNLLLFSSAVYFDNKFWITTAPQSDINQQITHQGLMVINFDLVSDLRDKQSPCWEGLNTGLIILQVDKCRIVDEERSFIWAQGPTDVELWEMTTDDEIADQFSVVNAGTITISTKAIAAVLQTRAEDYGLPMDLKRLIMGEIYIDEVADSITLSLAYKPDQFPNWVPWATVQICSTVSQCAPNPQPGVCFFQINADTYVARMTFPQPQDICNPITGKPMREFYEAQFQLSWTGHMRIKRFFTHTKLQTQPMEGICPPTVTCVAFPFCEDNFFTYNSHP